YEPAAPRRAWRAAAVLAAWLGLNLLALSPDFRHAVPRGGEGPAGPGLAVLLALPPSLVMAAAAWAAFRLTRRHTVAGRGASRALAVHGAAALGLAALLTLVRRAERLLLADPGPLFAPSTDAGEFAALLLVYALLVLAAHALEYARRYRERQLAELRLHASLARAELEGAAAELRVLKLQLNPHFLFNSLHAVSALVHDAPDAAERMVLRLGDLLRQAATRVGTQEVTLDEEVRTLEPFLEVERIRLDGRLRVEWDVDEEARGACVPHMVLQPLVENAIKHGLAGRAEGASVRIGARRRGPWLVLEVRDDGMGLAAAAAAGTGGTGIGTTNTRARLAQLYGSRQALEIAPAEGGGTRVSLRLPWHDVPLPARALAGTARGAEAAEAGPRGRAWLGWAAAAVFFLAVARRSALRMEGMPMPPAPRTVGPVEAAVCGTLQAAIITLLLAAAFVLARRAPLVPGARARSLRRHGRAALLLGVVATLELNGCSVFWGTPLRSLLRVEILAGMALEVLKAVCVFAAASVVAHALEYARRVRMTEAAGLRLQASLARAELQRTAAEVRGLRMQVNPRFLFTALAAVAQRVHDAPADAEGMVVRLADLLRQAMGATGVQEVPLEEEMRAAGPFLEVERIRLGGLRVEWDVDDEDLDAYVPPMLLPPVLLHAVGAQGDGCEGHVRVAARRQGRWLELEVRGHASAAAGPDAAAQEAAEDARARLERLYGADCAVEVGRLEGGGTRAVLRLPWHDEPWAAAPPAAAPREEIAAP
ncbi:MAG TPA: histidine kinase, partial [Longimicrobium sp.]